MNRAQIYSQVIAAAMSIPLAGDISATQASDPAWGWVVLRWARGQRWFASDKDNADALSRLYRLMINSVDHPLGVASITWLEYVYELIHESGRYENLCLPDSIRQITSRRFGRVATPKNEF